MSSTWIIVAFILGFLIVFQIAKASEYVAILRGEERTRKETNRINGFMPLAFLIVGPFVVFVMTQVALFYFAYKYQEKEGQKAYFYPHNNKLELIWTVSAAITLTVLVGFGLYYWFEIT